MEETTETKTAEPKKFKKTFSKDYAQTQMKFDAGTRQRIDEIREYYGLSTANAAVAVAVRVCHDAIQKPRTIAGKIEVGK